MLVIEIWTRSADHHTGPRLLQRSQTKASQKTALVIVHGSAEAADYSGRAYVRCDIIDQDQYRRLVGQCFIGDVDIGLAMVKAGLAEAMLRHLPATHSITEVEYGQAEGRARDGGFGMWSAEIESPHVHRRSKSSGNQ